MKTIEPHRRFSYDGANMSTSKKTIRNDDDFGKRVFVEGRGWVKREEVRVDPRTRRLELEKDFFEAAANLVQKTKALEEIKRDKLYRQVCETWEEYCDQILHQSASAVRLALKAFGISEKLTSAAVAPESLKSLQSNESVLSEKDLRKMARLPDQEVEVLLDGDLVDLPNKIADKTKARKPQKREFAKTDKELATDIWGKLIARLEAQKHNTGFVKALDEWLTESGF
jgi:hypothetical protein